MKQRAAYQWGATAYLCSFKVGECRVYKEGFNWRHLASIACYLSKVAGCRFKFRTNKGVKIIRRWK